MSTLVEDFRVRIQSKILCRSQFYRNIIEKDKMVFTKGKAIEIKITARKHQVSVESLLVCMNYLDHMSFMEIDITAKNMMSMLVTSNFLKISSLEGYCIDYIANNIHSGNVVDVANVAYQVKNLKLLNKVYMYVIYRFIRVILLYRFGQIDLPAEIKDNKDLIFNSPNLIYAKTNSKVNLEIFNYKSQESHIERKMYHVTYI